MFRNKIKNRVFFILLISALVASKPGNAQVSVPDNILVSLKSTHPRLLVRSLEDFDQLNARIKADKNLQKYAAQVRLSADSILSAKPVDYVLSTDQGGKLLEVSRVVLRRVYKLAMMYRLTHDSKYGDRLWKELSTAANFPDWNPRHFLDDAEMIHAFAIGYDWMYDYWTPDQRKVIKQAIVDKGLLRGYLGYNQLESNPVSNWSKSINNWNQVCNGGLTIGALAVADEEPNLAAWIIKKAINTVPNIMKRFAPDGASEEGPGYWAYGIKYNVAMIESLNTALGADFGLSDIPGFSNTGNYFITMGGPGGRVFSYSDNWLDTIKSPELFWFAKRYNQPLLASYEKLHPEYTPLELLWYPAGNIRGEDFPKNNYYRNAEVITLRSSWNDPQGLFIGFKGGNNAAGHAHLDLGTFSIQKNGVLWVMDLGRDEYGLPGYFDASANGQRWTYYRMRAEGHNTLVFNPDTVPDQNTSAKATMSYFHSTDKNAVAVLNLTEAYQKDADSVKRGIAMIDQNDVLVQDEVNSNKNIKSLYWFMHTAAKINLSGDKRQAILTQENKSMVVQLISPKGAVFEIMDAKPMNVSPHPPKQASNTGIKKLSIHLKNTASSTIAVLFKDAGSKHSVKIKPLSQWR